MFTELLNKKIIAISNYKISEEIELFSSKYDFIIRFNICSNNLVLSRYNFYNHKTDLCVLSGWRYGRFGNFNGFMDKKILFSRPKYSNDIKYGFKN